MEPDNEYAMTIIKIIRARNIYIIKEACNLVAKMFYWDNDTST